MKATPRVVVNKLIEASRNALPVKGLANGDGDGKANGNGNGNGHAAPLNFLQWCYKTFGDGITERVERHRELLQHAG